MTSLLEPGGTLGIAALVDESVSRTKESPSRIHSNGALGMDKEMNQTRDVDWADLQVITAEGESRKRAGLSTLLRGMHRSFAEPERLMEYMGAAGLQSIECRQRGAEY